MMKNCDAIQMSDQMCCAKCGLAWDVNDTMPPYCGKTTGIYRTNPVLPAYRAAVQSGNAPVGFSVFAEHREHLEAMVGWAFTPEQMVAITLQALGYHGRVLAPVGLAITVYREPDLDRMAFISRQRIAFTLPECNRAQQLLQDGNDPTTHWGDVQIKTALQVRRLIGAK